MLFDEVLQPYMYFISTTEIELLSSRLFFFFFFEASWMPQADQMIIAQKNTKFLPPKKSHRGCQIPVAARCGKVMPWWTTNMDRASVSWYFQPLPIFTATFFLAKNGTDKWKDNFFSKENWHAWYFCLNVFLWKRSYKLKVFVVRLRLVFFWVCIGSKKSGRLCDTLLRSNARPKKRAK